MTRERGYYRKHYNTPRWRALRYKLWTESNKRCKFCKRMALEFHIDHIKRVPHRYTEGYDFYEEDNLRVLCPECHSRHTGLTENKEHHHFRPHRLLLDKDDWV